MPRPDQVKRDGSFQSGVLEVGLSLEDVLDRIRRSVSVPLSKGGPFFSRHNYEGVTNGATFCIRQRATRGSPPKIEGSVEATPQGSLIRYEVRVNRGYFLLPFLPVALYVLSVGAYFLSTVMEPGKRAEGELGRSLLLFACAGLVFLLLVGVGVLLALVFQRQIVRNTLRFFRELFQDVEVLDAERVE